MKKALIPALLLLLGSTILGATLLREPLANAARLAQSVVISNTPDQAVPVREQNLDGDKNIKVHEQGTANVRVVDGDGAILTVAPLDARQTFFVPEIAPPGGSDATVFPNGPVDASLISLTSMRGTGYVLLGVESGTLLSFDTDGGNVVLPLTQPLTFDRIQLVCSQSSPVACTSQLNVIGR
jgi:hypothetical protein